MKNLILILALSIASQLVLSQIKVQGFAEIGYLDERVSLNKDGYVFNLDNRGSLYSDITLDFSWQKIHLEQQIYNIFKYIDGRSFRPIDVVYRTRVYYKIKFLAIGYDHMSSHPIIAQHNEIEPITRRMSHDKIFIRLTFGNGKTD